MTFIVLQHRVNSRKRAENERQRTAGNGLRNTALEQSCFIHETLNLVLYMTFFLHCMYYCQETIVLGGDIGVGAQGA